MKTTLDTGFLSSIVSPISPLRVLESQRPYCTTTLWSNPSLSLKTLSPSAERPYPELAYSNRGSPDALESTSTIKVAATILTIAKTNLPIKIFSFKISYKLLSDRINLDKNLYHEYFIIILGYFP